MMANAKECDICKKLYRLKEEEEKPNIRLVINYNPIDLCPSCQLELEKWYNSRKDKFVRKTHPIIET